MSESGGTRSSPTQCAGLFAPCSNPPDPARTLEDPDGRLPPVYICSTCGDATDALMGRVAAEGKLERLEFEVAAAAQQTDPVRGKA